MNRIEERLLESRVRARAGVRARDAFTLLEVVTAMLAGSVLVVSLAATVAVTTDLLESQSAETPRHRDKAFQDRLRDDLRYATEFASGASNGFIVTKYDPIDDSLVTATYQSDSDGFTRTVGGGPAMQLDPQSADATLELHASEEPEQTELTDAVKIFAVSQAGSDSAAASLAIAIPPGCQSGDLLLLGVASRGPHAIELAQSGWRVLRSEANANLQLQVFYRVHDPSADRTISLLADPVAPIAATMFAVDNADTVSPLVSTDAQAGSAEAAIARSHPSYLQPADVDPRQLNLQIYAAEDAPWNAGTIGLAGFADLTQVTAAPLADSLRTSIAAVARNGLAPSSATTGRVQHLVDGKWLHIAAVIEAAP